jgi:hypothetical protein
VIRRSAAFVALAAVLAAGTASHHHALMVSDSETSSEEVITRHSPFSSASHLHAILKIVPVDPCWACHWSRLSGISLSARVTRPVFTTWRLNALPPRSSASVARFTRRSRAPPSPLST